MLCESRLFGEPRELTEDERAEMRHMMRVGREHYNRCLGALWAKVEREKAQMSVQPKPVDPSFHSPWNVKGRG